MKLILCILLTTYTFANSIFWENVEKTQETFYEYEINNKIDDKELNTILTKKYNSYSKLLEILKNQPYDLVDSNNFLNKNIDNEIAIIKDKIQINSKYGYTLAVTRDKIKYSNLVLKNKIYDYFLYLADNWTTFNKSTLHKLNVEYKKELNKIKYNQFLKTYTKINTINGNIENSIKIEFKKLHKNYLFFKEFLVYIDNNKDILTYESLSNVLELGVLIDKINENIFFTKINTYLRFVHTSVGKLLLFFAIILIFFSFNILIYKKIYQYLKNMILNHEVHDDILLENLNKIRKPISLMIIFIGIKLALDVLIYPANMNYIVTNIFYIFYLFIFIYIVFVLIDNFLFLYLTKKEYKNKNIRKELVNLSVSIVKVTIFLVGFLLLLVKLDVDISNILASLGIGGLAIALAAQTTLSNFFGLLKMIFDNSFSQGDWIQTKDIEGIVVEVGFISTKLRTFDNGLITVPNAILANASIKNWSQRKVGRRIKMHIGVTYNSKLDDLKKALKQIEDMLKNHPDISTATKLDYKDIQTEYIKTQKLISIEDKYGIKSTLLVYLDKLSDSSVDILIYTFSKTTDWEKWLEVKQDVIYNIWEILESNNLEFAYPSQSIYLKKSK